MPGCQSAGDRGPATGRASPLGAGEMLDWRIAVLGRYLRSLDPETEEWLRIARWRGALLRRELNECAEYDPTSVMSIVV